MNNFYFHNPTKLYFGKGMLKKLPGEILNLSCKRVLIITGRESAKKYGYLDEVIQMLSQSNIKYNVYSGVQPNPTLSAVREALGIAREKSVQAILALGGGSTVDTAKSVAASFYYQGDPWDLFTGVFTPEKALPIYIILTLSATASEMNPTAVITNEKEKKKLSFAAGTFTSPKVSIVDPSMQFSLPAKQTVYGAIDAISHVLEYYFNGVRDVDVQDRISESIIVTIIDHVRKLLDDPQNYESRSQLAWSSILAFNGINAAGRFGGDFSTHIIEHSLSALYPDITHAEGLAVLFPNWMKYISGSDKNKYQKLKKILESNIIGKVESNIGAAECLRMIFDEWEAPSRLSDLGINHDNLKKIAKHAVSEEPIGKIRKLTRQDVLEILQLSY